MARKKTVVELVQMQQRAEACVLRAARRFNTQRGSGLLNAIDRLTEIDRRLAWAERKARHAVQGLVKRKK